MPILILPELLGILKESPVMLAIMKVENIKGAVAPFFYLLNNIF